jgi:hypothetical protein
LNPNRKALMMKDCQEFRVQLLEALSSSK